MGGKLELRPTSFPAAKWDPISFSNDIRERGIPDASNVIKEANSV
jgi:hypothetical protein